MKFLAFLLGCLLACSATANDPTLRIFVGKNKDLTVRFQVNRDDLRGVLSIILANDKPEVKTKLDKLFKESGEVTLVLSSKPTP